MVFIKSIIIIPEIFLSLNCLAVSFIASRFVFNLIIPSSFFRTFFPVFTSTTVRASVDSMHR